MKDNTTKKDRLWLLPDSTKGRIVPGLYLVSTPIGNLGDISFRALDTLAAADLVVCEDTRVTGKLLSYYGLEKTLLPYNDHNAERQRPKILDALKAGKIVALVSDAGTPLISDPGYKLVQDCKAADVYVSTVPGANAPLSALQLSGLPTDQFCFIGFLPQKQGPRKALLQSWVQVSATLVAFETGPRLIKALDDIAEIYAARDVAVVREITKLYEETRRGAAAELAAYYKSHGAPKGEIVLVIAPADDTLAGAQDVETLLLEALKTLKTKEAAIHVAGLTGQPRQSVYDLAVKLSKGNQ